MTSDSDYLRHILDSADWIIELTAEGENKLQTDVRTQDSYIRKFEVIGEAARRLSEHTRSLHPEIPWRQIIGMRNQLIHNYFGVDLDLVWLTATTILPDFRNTIAAMLDELERSE